MDRKGIIAVVLCIIGLIWWQIDNSKRNAAVLQYREQKEAEAKAAAEAEAQAHPPAAVLSGQPGAAPGAAAAPATPAEPERFEQLTGGKVNYFFTNLGGGIARVQLTDHLGEHNAPIELNRFGEIPIGSITEQAGEETNLPYQMEPSPGTGEITFRRVDPRHLQITKHFQVPKPGEEVYVAHLDVTFANQGPEPLVLPAYYVYAGSAAPIHLKDLPTYTGAGWKHAAGYEFKDANSFAQGGILGMGRTDMPTWQKQAPNTMWSAVTNQYFSTIVTVPEQKGAGTWAHRFAVDREWITAESRPVRTLGKPAATPATSMAAVEGALQMYGFQLAPGASASQRFEIYTGPREYERLKSLGNNQEEIMSFGWVSPVSKVLLASMNWLHSKLGSYAAAIIVLTLIIRSLMWPLQNKATQSMKRMQALSPKMTELKEKYKDDPARMNTEVMKLYRDNKVNPLSGCLPMLVQIPIFFGFYNMLGKAVELRNARFLWVHDLSQPDTVAILFGYPVNVLPMLMAVTMFTQMRLSPKSGDAAQQRIFMFMPLIFIFFCYNFASALALYWTVQNIFSIMQLYVTRNQKTPALQNATLTAKRKRA